MLGIEPRLLEEQLAFLTVEPSLQPSVLVSLAWLVARKLLILLSHPWYSAIPQSRPFGEMWSPSAYLQSPRVCLVIIFNVPWLKLRLFHMYFYV